MRHPIGKEWLLHNLIARPTGVFSIPQYSMVLIEKMLNRRRTAIRKNDTDTSGMRARLDTSKLIGAEFDRFDPIRLLIQSRGIASSQIFRRDLPDFSLNLLDYLIKNSILEACCQDSFCVSSDPELRRYISGGWLEELVAAAALSAGAEEVLLSVEIERVIFPGRYNEIDVIALQKGRLHFISCKGLKILPTHYQKNMKPWNRAAKEIRRRVSQYGQRSDTATLVTSMDLFKGTKVRSPIQYLEQFSKHNRVTVIGFENLDFDQLVQVMKTHLTKVAKTGLALPTNKEPIQEALQKDQSTKSRMYTFS